MIPWPRLATGWQGLSPLAPIRSLTEAWWEIGTTGSSKVLLTCLECDGNFTQLFFGFLFSNVSFPQLDVWNESWYFGQEKFHLVFQFSCFIFRFQIILIGRHGSTRSPFPVNLFDDLWCLDLSSNFFSFWCRHQVFTWLNMIAPLCTTLLLGAKHSKPNHFNVKANLYVCFLRR